MQIKSYILVRVTEALKSVSGLHGQRGFFCVVSRTEASTPPMWELTFRAAQFRRGWGGHPASLARGARAACSAVGTRQLVARRGPGMPPRWLGGGQQQRARGFWHLQTSPHKHTEKADQTLILHGWTSSFCRVTKSNLTKCSRIKLRGCTGRCDFHL